MALTAITVNVWPWNSQPAPSFVQARTVVSREAEKTVPVEEQPVVCVSENLFIILFVVKTKPGQVDVIILLLLYLRLTFHAIDAPLVTLKNLDFPALPQFRHRYSIVIPAGDN